MSYEDPAARRKREYLRATGRGYMMRGDEVTPALEHVRNLHAMGMSCTSIAEQSGISQSVVTEAYKGFRYRDGSLVPVDQMRRSTVVALLAVKFVPPPAGSVVNRSGARLPCIRARRQMQALQARGFSLEVLAAQMGRSKAWLGTFTVGSAGSYSHSYTLTEFDALYEKLRDAEPADYGMMERTITNVANQARRKGYAPGHCWDDEPPTPEELAEGTISHHWDDPDAIPEWTGACGTMDGYYLHIKYKLLPNCPPCRKAKTEYNKVHEAAPGRRPFDQDIRNLIALGHSHESILDITGCCLRTLDRTLRRMESEG